MNRAIAFSTIADKKVFNLLKMLLISYKDTQKIKRDWLIYDFGLEDEQKSELDSIVEHITFLNIPYHEFEGIRFKNHIRMDWDGNGVGRNIYNPAYRFVLFLNNLYHNIVYMDCDMIFFEDIEEIFTEEMLSCDFVAAPRHLPREERGLEFFNAGFFILNKKVRNLRNFSKLVEMSKKA